MSCLGRARKASGYEPGQEWECVEKKRRLCVFSCVCLIVRMQPTCIHALVSSCTMCALRWERVVELGWRGDVSSRHTLGLIYGCRVHLLLIRLSVSSDWRVFGLPVSGDKQGFFFPRRGLVSRNMEIICSPCSPHPVLDSHLSSRNTVPGEDEWRGNASGLSSEPWS